MTPVTPILAAAPGHILAHVLLALAAVVIVGRLVGRLFEYLGQPPVIGEVVAGILLGPSFLGWISQNLFQVNATEFLLPKDVSPYLGVIAQLGVILYMFLVGLELNAGLLRAQAKAAIGISAAGMVAPFLLGVALAYPLRERFAPADVPFSSFALFLGIALAVTAFPVLARILTDRGIARTRLGVLALSCAAVGDAAAWCLLAVIVGVVQARIDDALVVIGLSAAFIAFMLLAVRPLATRWARRLDGRPLTPTIAAWIFAAVLLSALATEAIGIHGLFGAFLLGVVIPHDCRVARELEHRLKEVVVVLFLPAFFAYTGLRTQIGLISGWEEWLVCGVIILAATVGKFGGTLAAARLTGFDWRMSASLGVLMNTRGLMELIVLNIGLDLGVISPVLFTMLVLMALVTTLATAPMLKRLMPREEVPHPSDRSRTVAAAAGGSAVRTET